MKPTPFRSEVDLAPIPFGQELSHGDIKLGSSARRWELMTHRSARYCVQAVRRVLEVACFCYMT